MPIDLDKAELNPPAIVRKAEDPLASAGLPSWRESVLPHQADLSALRLDADQERSFNRALRGLEAAHSLAIVDLAKDRPEDLKAVISAGSFWKLSDEGRLEVMSAMASRHSRGDSVTSLRWIVARPELLEYSAAEQKAILVLAEKNSLGGEVIATVLARRMDDGTLALRSKDSKGETLLANLTSFGSLKYNPAIAAAKVNPSRALAHVLQEIGDPDRWIEQGSKGACAPASTHYLMAKEDPAELVRLVNGLFSAGAVEMRKGGKLELVPDSLASDGSARSDIERIFQSSLFKYASPHLAFSNKNDGFTFEIPGIGLGIPLGGGQTRAAIERTLEGVTGRDHERVDGEGSAILDRLKQQKGRVQITMRWDTGLHAVVYTGAKEGYVYLRDPNGEGIIEGNPPRERASFNGSNIRMREGDFEKLVREAFLPRASGSR